MKCPVKLCGEDAAGILGLCRYRCPQSIKKPGGIMTDIIPNKRFANSRWAERKQDFLIVSSFALWSMLLGLTPVLALNFLVGS